MEGESIFKYTFALKKKYFKEDTGKTFYLLLLKAEWRYDLQSRIWHFTIISPAFPDTLE